MREYLHSAVQSTELLKDAAGAVLGELVARLDGWLCDYGDDSES